MQLPTNFLSEDLNNHIIFNRLNSLTQQAHLIHHKAHVLTQCMLSWDRDKYLEDRWFIHAPGWFPVSLPTVAARTPVFSCQAVGRSGDSQLVPLYNLKDQSSELHSAIPRKIKCILIPHIKFPPYMHLTLLTTHSFHFTMQLADASTLANEHTPPFTRFVMFTTYAYTNYQF